MSAPFEPLARIAAELDGISGRRFDDPELAHTLERIAGIVAEARPAREGLTLAERLAEATVWPAETWQQIIDAAQQGADPAAGYRPRHIVIGPDTGR